MTTAPVVSYWHVWTDADGISHQSREQIDDFTLASISMGASPQWLGPRTDADASVLFTVMPPGWVGEWHENPARQWIIPISGRWAVETMDGTQVEMGPGEVSLGDDLGTRERDGKRGHRSWTVGEQPVVLMLMQFKLHKST